MKEIESIIQAYDRAKSQGKKMAMATVIHVENSSYRRSGARMLIHENGEWTGGISGGCLEGDTLQKAQYVMFSGEPTIVRYDTRDGDENQIGVGLGCNGLIDVLIAPILQNSHNQIDVLRNSTMTREPSVILTIVESSNSEIKAGVLYAAKSLDDFLSQVYDGNVAKKIQSDFRDVTQYKKSKGYSYKTEKNTLQLFIEYIPPPIQLLIFGRNYDVIPLLRIAKEIGWRCHVFANPKKVSKNIYSMAESVQIPSKVIDFTDPYSVCLLMAHDYETDKNNLRLTHDLRMSYVGILGPRARSQKVIQELHEEGLSIIFNNIYAPMGLDTGATTPEEIAISIIAEVRSVFAGRKGENLRDRREKIND